jgi:hypothetical protein
VTGEWRVEVRPGAGAVCRAGDVTLWLGDDVPAGLAPRLLELASGLGGMPRPGPLLALRISELLAAGSGAVGSFAAVAPGTSGVTVVLHGSAGVAADRETRLRGDGAPSGVATEVPATAALAVGGGPVVDYGPGPLPSPAALDLRDGTVPGGGFVLRPPDLEAAPPQPEHGGAVLIDLSVAPERTWPPLPIASTPAPARAPAPPEPVEPAPVGIPTAEVGVAPPISAAEGVAVVEVGAPDEAAPAGDHRAEMVRGILCARQHFNHPRALYCATCGIAMVHQTHVLVSGRRPSLGVIVLDDGSTFSLDSAYVVGRSPESAEDVRTGRARPLVLSDEQSLISRAHVRLGLHDWDVVVTDLGSANGTSLWNPGDPEWTRLQPNQGVVLGGGGRLTLGRRTMVYETGIRR